MGSKKRARKAKMRKPRPLIITSFNSLKLSTDDSSDAAIHKYKQMYAWLGKAIAYLEAQDG